VTTTEPKKYTLHWRDNNDDEDYANSDDDDMRIRLPRLKYGYRTVPLEFEEIVDFITNDDIAKLSRSVAQQRDYEMYKRDLLQHWKTVLDHVLCSKFPNVFRKKSVGTEDDGDGRLLFVADPTLETAAALYSSSSTAPATALVPNDFPYYMADGLEHWVLWKLGGGDDDGPCTERDIAQAKEQLVRHHNFVDPKRMIHWVNPPHLQSLPGIDHVHIIGVVNKNQKTVQQQQHEEEATE